MAAGLHFRKQLVDEDEFAGGLHHGLQVEVQGRGAAYLAKILQDLLLRA